MLLQVCHPNPPPPAEPAPSTRWLGCSIYPTCNKSLMHTPRERVCKSPGTIKTPAGGSENHNTLLPRHTHPHPSTHLGHLPSYPKRGWVLAQCSPLSHLLSPSLPAALGFHLEHPGLVPAPSVSAAPITDQATAWGYHPTTGESLQGLTKSPVPPETPAERISFGSQTLPSPPG